MKTSFAAFAIMSAVAFTTNAQETSPPGETSREELTPEIIIKETEPGIVEEYRVAGQLYMIKVNPRKGVPYFLIDTDGDGNLETRRNDVESDLLIPTWVLFRFD